MSSEINSEDNIILLNFISCLTDYRNKLSGDFSKAKDATFDMDEQLYNKIKEKLTHDSPFRQRIDSIVKNKDPIGIFCGIIVEQVFDYKVPI